MASTTIERPSGVSSASEESCATSASSASGTPSTRDELRGLAVAERDRAGLVEQQHVDVAGRLDRAARHREHVALHEPVHAGDPDRREQRADRRRDQRDEQRDQHRLRDRGVRVESERPQRHDRDEEGDRQPREQDVQRDLVRRLAPLGALDQRDHAVEERLARLLGDLDDEPVGEQARTAGDRGAVAAGLADHRRRLAGDRRLVDRADALDHLAVGGDHLAGLDDDDVAALQLRAGRVLPSCSARRSRCASRAACSPAPCRGPRRSPRRSSRRARSATARPRSRTRPRRLVAAAQRLAAADRMNHVPVVITLPTSTMNITGFLSCRRGSSLGNESRTARRTISGWNSEIARRSSEPTAGGRRDRSTSASSGQRSSARLSSSTLTPGSPKKPSPRPSCTSRSGLHRRERQVAHARDPARLDPRWRGRSRGRSPSPTG